MNPFEADYQFRNEILEKIEVGVRQEISPMVLMTHKSNLDYVSADVVNGIIIQFAGYFWQNQTTDIVKYTVPNGQWEWFKKRFMVDSRLHRFCNWVASWKWKDKWKWSHRLFQWRTKKWFIKLFDVKMKEFEEKVSIVYPYMATQDVPSNMGRISIPVMPDGAALGLLPDARIKQPRRKHVPIWVDQEAALALKEEAERHRLPLEEVIRMAISDSFTLSVHRR